MKPLELWWKGPGYVLSWQFNLAASPVVLLLARMKCVSMEPRDVGDTKTMGCFVRTTEGAGWHWLLGRSLAQQMEVLERQD